MKRFILASASPRRKQLLAQLVGSYEVIPSAFDEVAVGLSASETVAFFATEKAKEVFLRNPDAIVLGSDTVVVLDGKILGKPKDGEDAARMLTALSGRTHEVLTGVCLLADGLERVEVVSTKVQFYPLSEQTVCDYVKSGLPLDKAGAYGIQDGYPLVERIEGSYTNVVGLPVERLSEIFKEEGLC